jgi:hypothetical protein
MSVRLFIQKKKDVSEICLVFYKGDNIPSVFFRGRRGYIYGEEGGTPALVIYIYIYRKSYGIIYIYIYVVKATQCRGSCVAFDSLSLPPP